MPLIRCVSAYRSDTGGEWPAGKADVVSDELAAYLLRDSPSSFELVQAKPEPSETVSDEPGLDAISTETATGLTVPDRRARGGRRR